MTAAYFDLSRVSSGRRSGLETDRQCRGRAVPVPDRVGISTLATGPEAPIGVIAVRTQPFGQPLNAGGRPRLIGMREKTRLKEALLGVDVLKHPDRRDVLVRELREELGPIFDPARSSTQWPDIWEIVSTCVRLGAMEDLVDALDLIDGKTPEWRRLNDLVLQMFPRKVLRVADRAVFEELLADVPDDVLEGALEALEDALDADLEIKSPGAYPEVLREVEHVVFEHSDDRKPLWIFLESIAHSADDDVAYEEWHRAIGAAARAVGRSDRQVVDDICASLGNQDGPVESSEIPADLNDLEEPARIDAQTEGSEDETESGDDDVDTGAPPSLRTRRKQTSMPAIWGGVPPRNPFFTGRLDLLDRLRHTLRPSARATMLPNALHGLGGVGKTQVAIEFAYQSRTDYDLIWWIPAGDERSIRRSLVSLGRKLALPEGEDQQFLVESVLDELRLGRDHPRWLVIFDNAIEPEVVEKYIPGGPGNVVITSRDRSWVSASTVVEVNVFHADESVEFLRSKWTDLTEEQAGRLARRLGHLPLALAQAVAVHEQTGMPLDDYLRLLESSPARLLDQETAAGYAEPLARTFTVAFEHLTERSPAAAQLLRVCAFLSPQPISTPMLRKGRGVSGLPQQLADLLSDDLAFRTAVQDIGKYALAQIDPERDLLTVHMLVAAVLRGVLTEDQRTEIRRQAHQVLALANPGSPDASQYWVQHAQIASHVLDSGISGAQDNNALEVVIDQIRYLFAIGDYAQSEKVARAALSDWHERLGAANLLTLRAQFHLGNILRVTGRYEEARSLTETTMDLFQQEYGAEHEYTLQVANSLTSDLRLIGDFVRARELDEENLRRHRAVLGEQHPGTLRAANNLALDYRLFGDFKQALEIDQENVRVRETLLDPAGKSPETLLSVNNLVRDMYGMGDYAEAVKLQEDKLQWFESRLRANHRVLLLGRRNMAILWRRLGKYDLALSQAEVDAETCLSQLGPRHEHTLAAQMTLVNSLRAAGHDLVRAMALAEETWTEYQDRFGGLHPVTLACAVNVAIVMRAQGNFTGARTVDEAAHAGFTAVYGENHQFSLCAAANLANDAAALEGPQRARELSEAVLARSVEVRGVDHPYTLFAAANHALDLSAVGDHEKAMQLRTVTLSSMQLRLGPEHPQTVSVERGRRAEADIEFPPCDPLLVHVMWGIHSDQ